MYLNLFWTAFGAIGTSLGALATSIAVIVALWQTKYSQKKKLDLYFTDNFQLYNQKTGEAVKFIGISVSNIGNRKVIIVNWGMNLNEGQVLILRPTDAGYLERLGYVDLPKGLDIEEKLDLQWQIDRFKAFLKENEENIRKQKPLEFFVVDSTGKKYCVKTKKKALEYF